MAVFDLFSKRQARLRGEVPDVYTYDDAPQKLRVQLVYIIRDLLEGSSGDSDSHPNVAKSYLNIRSILRREYGVFCLLGKGYLSAHEELFEFITSSESTEKVLDAIELSVKYAEKVTNNFDYLYEHSNGASRRISNGIQELNERFEEHAFGYRYEEGMLVRIDSDLIHKHSVVPALTLLRTSDFPGPREEFLRAHEHYRHGRYKEALNECLKSFESTMKAVCERHGWAYDKDASAKQLVAACMDNNLLEPFWQDHITGIRLTLESGINTIRNKLGGHGQGASVKEVPSEVATYCLHLTASVIVLLIQSSGRLE